jgi:hypothetical protein
MRQMIKIQEHISQTHQNRFPVKKLIFVLATLFICGKYNLNAQRGWEIGGWGGVANYFGDLNTAFRVNKPGGAGGLIFRYNINDRLCLKVGANYGFLSADDKNSLNDFERARNLHFKTNVFEGIGQFEFNFLSYNYFDKNKWFSPYLFGGFGVLNFDPKAEYQGTWFNLRDYGTEGQFRGEEYFTTQAMLVYGMGLKIALNETWAINIDISGRRLFTDYLDDVSGAYPNRNEVRRLRGDVGVALADPSYLVGDGKLIGTQGRQRGDRRANDMYALLGIGIVYYFGDLRCPPVSNR